jgi:ACS family tartrate transporter-like MFS transporter
MALVNGETTFYIIRFLLGAAEAGFFPAILFFLTLWFPAAQRVTVLGIFILAQPVSNALGAPVSGLLLQMDGVMGLQGWQWLYIIEGIPAILFFLTLWFPAAQRVTVLGIFILAQPVSNALGAPVSGLLLQMDGIMGLQGWQWLYIIEGIPAILLGLLTPILMTDRPSHAHWLADDEREWLTKTMDEELAHKQKGQPHHFLAGLKDPRTIAYSALYFGLVCGIYGLGLWMPTIVAALGKFSTTEVGFIVAIPYTIAAVFVYFWGRRSDRTGNRVMHASISMVMAAVGLLAAGFLVQVNAILAMTALTLAAMGIYSAIAPFLAMPSTALVGAAAAAGLAMVNSLGNLGGFVAPYAVGLFNDATGDNRSGLVFLAACLGITAVATFLYARKRPEGHVKPGTPSTVGEEAVAADEFDIKN